MGIAVGARRRAEGARLDGPRWLIGVAMVAAAWVAWPLTGRAAAVAPQAVASAPAAARVQTTGAPPRVSSGVTLNFPETDVASAARVMADVLGRALWVDPRAKGKLTLYTEQAVSAPQAMALFAAELRSLGLALVDTGGLLKVVPEAEAKLQTGTLRSTRQPLDGDPVLTQIFRINHESAANLLPVLRPLISPQNLINVAAGSNALVVTDYASNLQRVAQIIAALDQPSATDVEVLVLQHAVAADLAATVQRLTDDGAGTGGSSSVSRSAAGSSGGVNAGPLASSLSNNGPNTASGAASAASIVADGRLNALLVRAANPARLAAIRALVARLDQPGSAGLGGSQVHVIYLQHAEATRLAAVLRAAFAADGGGAAGSNAGAAPSSRALAASAGAGATASSAGAGAASAASVASVAGAAAPTTGGWVQADPASNALIVTAAEPFFRQIRAVVDQLDTRRAQLYVESLVVEVDASKALDVGLQWKQIFNISSSTSLTLGTVAQAIEATSGTNILSTANLVTLDNEEAKIVVGQNVPFVTGSYTSSTSASPFQTIERKDVGLTLRIRPQIGPGGSIRMSILQESSAVSSTTTPGTTNAGPATSKRAIESTVVVGDGKIIVLGGLIEDSVTSDADQWPVLGEIPLLGAFFRTLSRTRKKTNLMVFLRPVVMPDEDSADRLSLDRYDAIRARQQAQPADVRQVLLDTTPLPLAPALPGRAATDPHETAD